MYTSVGLKLLYCLILINYNVNQIQASSRADESIFETDFCSEECDGNPHTMCPIKDPKPNCSSFELHKFDIGSDSQKLLKILIHGHNGIRNRIAERMEVPYMLEVEWDTKLARMAENYLYRCKSRIPDPCTLNPRVLGEDETFNEFFKFNHLDAYIVQNMYHEKGEFYPFKFLERVIRYWYFEKDGMREPIIDDSTGIRMKRLHGENNFTHFANPLSYRFGCGMARFDNAFHILCNYYPYYRTMTNTMLFKTGNPGTACPAQFPLLNEMFSNLCTADSTNFGGCAALRPILLLIIFVVFCGVLKLFLEKEIF